MKEPKTILVVDDEPKIVDVIKSYLIKSGFDVACAFDGGSALNLFDRCAPALVVLDLMLPGLPGEAVCRAIRKKSCVPIIMLTAKTDEDSVLQGLGIGADDYMLKPFSPRELVARVEAVLRRAADTSSAPSEDVLVFHNGGLVLDSIRHEVQKNGQPLQLTPAEFNIIFTMAKHPAKTFTREELIALALSDGYEGFDRVIDTHIKNIRQKIEDNARNPRYIKTVHGIGYAFGGELV